MNALRTGRFWAGRISVFLVVSCVGLQAAMFRAGVAKTDITPPRGLPMYGYFDRIKDNKLSTGTLDPLYARVLVLEVGDRRVALVTLDLGRTFGEPVLAQLRQKVKAAAGISFLIVTASHTHAGPNILDEYPANRPPDWETNAVEKIAGAVSEASKHLVDARLGTGRGEVYIGYNRRQVHPDQSVTMLWTNPDKQPTSPLDPTVLVLRIDDSSGKPIAVLVNYACHPVVFGSDNLKYSADYVGVMRNTVEKAFDGAPICFFLQGGDGDINPYYATTPLSEGAIEKRDWTGQQLGEEAARVAKGIKTHAPPNAALDFADDVMTFQLRWNPTRFREEMLSNFGPRVFEDHADLLAHDPPPSHLDLHVTTLLLNKEIAFMGLPGEPFVDVEVGAGERMLRQGLVRVYEFLGRLSDAPERN